MLFRIVKNANVLINVSINVPINVFLNLTELESIVLEILKSNKGIKKSQIATMVNKTEMTIQRTIKKLLDKNLIRRVGSNKTGWWQVV